MCRAGSWIRWCALGRPREPLLVDCRDAAVERVALPDGAAIVVVDSGVRRSLSDGRYAERRAACDAAAARIGVPSLRDATPEQVADDPVARHVVSENERVHRMVRALRAGDLDDAGAVLTEGHAACATTSRSRRPSSTPWSSGCSASARTAPASRAAGSAAAYRARGPGSRARRGRRRVRLLTPRGKNGVRPQSFRPGRSSLALRADLGPCDLQGSLWCRSRCRAERTAWPLVLLGAALWPRCLPARSSAGRQSCPPCGSTPLWLSFVVGFGVMAVAYEGLLLAGAGFGGGTVGIAVGFYVTADSILDRWWLNRRPSPHRDACHTGVGLATQQWGHDPVFHSATRRGRGGGRTRSSSRPRRRALRRRGPRRCRRRCGRGSSGRGRRR